MQTSAVRRIPAWTRPVMRTATAVLVLVAPFNSAAHLAEFPEEDGTWLAWDRPMRDALPWAFDFGSAFEVHLAYSAVMTVGLLLAVLAWAMLRPGPLDTRGGRLGYRLVLLGLAILTTGAVVEQTRLSFNPVLIGLPGALLLIPAHIVLGVALLRGGPAYKGLGWLFVTVGVLFIPVVATMGNFSGGIAVVAVAWTVTANRLVPPTHAAAAPRGARPA